jgi:type VI secretion system protein ImpE
LYVDSWKHASDQVRLGRMTDWRDAGEELYIGEGQKLFFIDGEDRPIMELEKVEFNVEEMAESA